MLRRPIVSSSTSPTMRMSEELLEIRAADDAFERIEEWLNARGFGAPGWEKFVADVYLGYGLSQTLRRSASAAPPEPCPALPLAAEAEESWTKAGPLLTALGSRVPEAALA